MAVLSTSLEVNNVFAHAYYPAALRTLAAVTVHLFSHLHPGPSFPSLMLWAPFVGWKIRQQSVFIQDRTPGVGDYRPLQHPKSPHVWWLMLVGERTLYVQSPFIDQRIPYTAQGLKGARLQRQSMGPPHAHRSPPADEVSLGWRVRCHDERAHGFPRLLYLPG